MFDWPDFRIAFAIQAVVVGVAFLLSELNSIIELSRDDRCIAGLVKEATAKDFPESELKRFFRSEMTKSLAVWIVASAAAVAMYWLLLRWVWSGHTVSGEVHYTAGPLVWVFSGLIVGLFLMSPIGNLISLWRYGVKGFLDRNAAYWDWKKADHKGIRRMFIFNMWASRGLYILVLVFPIFAMNWSVSIGADRIVDNRIFSLHERVITSDEIAFVWEPDYSRRMSKSADPSPLIALELHSGELVEFEWFSFIGGDEFRGRFRAFAEQHSIGYDRVQFLPDRLKGKP